jgi:soluble lytic murein transglycosylase
MKVGVLVLLLSWLLVSSTADNSQTTLLTPFHNAPLPSLASLNPTALHRLIVDHVDQGEYGEATRALLYLKTTYPDRYNSLPYELLHAKSAMLVGDLVSASAMYGHLSSDPRLSRYALLSLARIAAKQDRTTDAIRAYREYLTHTAYPNYTQVALEALLYCDRLKDAESLKIIARTTSASASVQRLSTFYLAKAALIQGDRPQALQMLKSLIRFQKKDDATALALAELDPLDGAALAEGDLISRGRLAYSVWNFPLARKYLQPVAQAGIQNSYYYGRALYFLGDRAGSKAAFEKAIQLWPKDPWTPICMEQYANLCIRDGDRKKAEEILSRLPTARSADTTTHRLVQALRAERKFEEALQLLEPSCNSRDGSTQARAIFLRGRIRYQMDLYREAYTDFDLLLKRKPHALDLREVEFWKAFMLEKMKHPDDASQIYSALAQRSDYFGVLAREKLPALTARAQDGKHECAFPEPPEDEIVNSYLAGDDVPAFLHLHLYQEVVQSLTVPALVRFLDLERQPRSVRLLEIVHVTGLGGEYPTANYYSELFQKSAANMDSISTDTLRILFPWAYRQTIERYAEERGVDPLLVLAVMKQESHFKPLARSTVFARGLMQLIPTTALQIASSLGLADFNVEQLYFPEVNVNLGTKYLQEMVAQFGPRVDVLAAAYNGGEVNTRFWLGAASTAEPIEFFSNIDFAQTREYVKLVRVNYEWYRRIYPQ